MAPSVCSQPLSPDGLPSADQQHLLHRLMLYILQASHKRFRDNIHIPRQTDFVSTYYLRGQPRGHQYRATSSIFLSLESFHPAFYLKLHSHERIAFAYVAEISLPQPSRRMASLRLSSYCVGLASLLLTSTCVQPERHVDVSITHAEHRMSCTPIKWNAASTADLRLLKPLGALHSHVAS
jgi:hypothetical protein